MVSLLITGENLYFLAIIKLFSQVYKLRKFKVVYFEFCLIKLQLDMLD